jgi:hypothetical protein
MAFRLFALCKWFFLKLPQKDIDLILLLIVEILFPVLINIVLSELSQMALNKQKFTFSE